ncbi:MAG: type II toxin-antitoxin system VapC family toxin [Akkermansiaceae bacterium]|nr:type II toxin-antitoxin system VapC family toxin [Akkermansiaceae bacterium]
MTYLLDTIAWLSLVQSLVEEIASSVRSLIASQTNLALSPQSIIEVAQKWSKSPDFLSIPLEEWIERALLHSITLLPITPQIACDAYRLRDFHGDPADRVICATARQYRLTLVTSDLRLIAHPEVKTLSTR